MIMSWISVGKVSMGLVKSMYQFYLGASALTTVGYFVYRYYRRRQLEERQLQMFLESLVLNTETHEWEVERGEPIHYLEK